MKAQVRCLQRFFRAGNSFLLECACRCSQAGGIEQADWHSAKIDHFFDRITRGAVRFAHDHAFVTEKPIQQARFTCIGRTVNHHPDAFAQNAALVGRGEQSGDFLANRIEARLQGFSFIRRDAFLRKIDRGVDVRRHGNQFVADLSDLLTEPAFELLGGGTQCEIGPGANQIDDCFGLG